MPISISCRHCDWKGKVKDDMGGKTGKCPTCGEHIAIPRSKSGPPPRPKSKPRADEPDVVEDEDDEPRARKRLSSSEGIPSTAKARAKSRRYDVDDDEPPPRKRRPRDDDDEDDRPRKKKRRRKPPEGINSKKAGAIVGGLFAALIGGAWLAWMFLGDGRFRVYPIILLVIGLIGLFQGFTGVGLGDSDDDE